MFQDFQCNAFVVSVLKRLKMLREQIAEIPAGQQVGLETNLELPHSLDLSNSEKQFH